MAILALPVAGAGVAAYIAWGVKVALLAALTKFVLRVFTTLGLAVGVYFLLVDPMVDLIQAELTAAPEWVTGTAGLLGLDVAITMIASAIAIRQIRIAIVPRLTP